jgi:hypothetical protein
MGASLRRVIVLCGILLAGPAAVAQTPPPKPYLVWRIFAGVGQPFCMVEDAISAAGNPSMDACKDMKAGQKWAPAPGVSMAQSSSWGNPTAGGAGNVVSYCAYAPSREALLVDCANGPTP